MIEGDGGALRWAQDCRQAGEQGSPWPAREAAALYRLVLGAPSGAEGEEIEAAARAFAVATGSMGALARRMSALRQVVSAVVSEQGLDRARVAAALDRATVAATQAALAQLEGAALTDPLTECGNRRALEMAAPAALALANRTGQPLSVVTIDLDGLKVLNDNQGHAAGDRALAGLSAAVRAALRATDQLFRIGGDEFVVLLPLATEAHVADMVRRMQIFNAPKFSWGAATTPGDGADLDTLLRVADARLYESRRAAGYQRQGRVAAAPPSPAAAVAVAAHHWARAAVVAAFSMAVVAVLAFVLGTRPGTPSPADGTSPSGQPSTSLPGTGNGGGTGGGNGTSGGSGPTSSVAGGGSGSTTTTSGGGSGNGGGGNSSTTTSTTLPLPTTTVTLPTTTTIPITTTTTSLLGGLLHGLKL